MHALHRIPFYPVYNTEDQNQEAMIQLPNSEFKFDIVDLAPLRSFLSSQRQLLQKAMQETPPDTLVHIVMGNQSNDLDSIIAAMVRAYHLSLTLGATSLCLPYMNMLRHELALHKEALYLFDNFGISVDDLSFLDDQITLEAIFSKAQLQLHLVDHNELAPEQKHLSSSVVEIVDHHNDTQKYPHLQQKAIQTVGSCCTLVASQLLQSLPLANIPKALAGLLLAPILIDTDNLNSSSKTTPLDRKMAETLLGHVAAFLPSDYHERIVAKKKDISGLSKDLLLIKDFKLHEAGKIRYGMSTLTSADSFWIDNCESMQEHLQVLSQKRNLDFLILMMPCKLSGKKQRGIVLYSTSCQVLDALVGFVQENAFLANLLKQQKSPSMESVKSTLFYTADTPLPRKVLQPKIDEIVSSESFQSAI